MSKAEQKQIDAWKKEHNVAEIHEIIVLKPKAEQKDTKKIEFDEFYAYAKKPSIQVLGLVRKFEESDPAKSWEILYSNTKIHVDTEIENDDELKMAVIAQMTNLFTHYLSSVKKL